MSNYQKILETKYLIAETRKELNELKKLQPSEETAKRVLACEKRARELTTCAKMLARSYGFAS